MEKILLHVSCPASSIQAIRQLSANYDVTLFFYSPNLFPESKFFTSLRQFQLVSQLFGLPSIIGHYDSADWFARIKGLESAPSGGNRCDVCSTMRMQATAELAKRNGFLTFATTASAGMPHSLARINLAGHRFADSLGLRFLEEDFSSAAYRRQNEFFAREHNLQTSERCGCFFAEKENF